MNRFELFGFLFNFIDYFGIFWFNFCALKWFFQNHWIWTKLNLIIFFLCIWNQSDLFLFTNNHNWRRNFDDKKNKNFHKLFPSSFFFLVKYLHLAKHKKFNYFILTHIKNQSNIFSLIKYLAFHFISFDFITIFAFEKKKKDCQSMHKTIWIE